MGKINVAIIGASGFIGNALTACLSKDDHVQLFLFGRNANSKHADNLNYQKIDLGDKTGVTKLFAKIDYVYYLISETIPASSWQNPSIEIEKNLLPFINFMESISTLTVKKVIFVSSAGTIYGPTDKKVHEESNKHPFSPYGITKLTMEYFLNYFEKKYGIKYDVYRVSNVYGPGQDTSKGLGIINTFLEKIISEGSINIFGSGENTRNYIFIEDVAEIMKYSLDPKNENSNTFNLSSNETLTINEVVKIMQKSIPETFKIIYTATRQSDNTDIILDNSKIKTVVPTHKFNTIEEGIFKTYTAIKQKQTAKT